MCLQPPLAGLVRVTAEGRRPTQRAARARRPLVQRRCHPHSQQQPAALGRDEHLVRVRVWVRVRVRVWVRVGLRVEG